MTIYSGASSASKTVTVTTESGGALSVESNDASIATAVISGKTVTITFVAVGTATVTVSQAADGDYKSATATIAVTAAYGIRYGYRIKKSEGSPSARVEYLFDAVGKTPAQMNFSTGKFDYGDLADAWFVKENKPCMLKNNGTVDYYLNPNDYTKKEDGTSSDVANTSYAGNAMSQIPLCWVKRYEDNDYYYEIVSDVQCDEDYKAYAHTRADGSIAEFFYWGMFNGSDVGSEKMRSLSGRSCSTGAAMQTSINACRANGSQWYIPTWSQKELIRTLLVLMGKSTDTQAVFGNGHYRSSGSSNNGALTTGTLKDKGQFFGYSDSAHQVKVFHIEDFWHELDTYFAGLLGNNGTIYVKMTPEGQGYRVTDVTGYHAIDGLSTGDGFISAGRMTEYGFFPTAFSGSGTTYECDRGAIVEGFVACNIGFADGIAMGGAFRFGVGSEPGYASYNYGCAISCEQPAAA